VSADFVEQRRELYEKTRNVEYLWEAIWWCTHGANKPFPAWLLTYLRETARALTHELPKQAKARGEDRPSPSDILVALGFVFDGNKNAYVEAEKDNAAAWESLSYHYLGGGDQAADKLAAERLNKKKPKATAREHHAEVQSVRRRVRRAKKSGRHVD
jgi:hypothetical protein